MWRPDRIGGLVPQWRPGCAAGHRLLGSTAILAFGSGLLGRASGWWAIAFLAEIGIIIEVVPTQGITMAAMTAVLGIPLVVALFDWMVSLARDPSRAEPSESV